MKPIDDVEDSEDVATLQERVTRLERENAALEARLGEHPSSALMEIHQDLLRQIAKSEGRVRELEKENRDFAGMYVEIQEQYQAITSLYVASQRLHESLDPDEVMRIIMEILIEVIGAEEFGILLLDHDEKSLKLVAGEGAREHVPASVIPLGAGIVGDVAASGEPFYYESGGPEALKAHLPVAAIPLEMKGTTVGVIAIYRLLKHKVDFSPVDHQVLQLLAAHAATALVSARLHKTMSRKLRTVEGFMQLIRQK